MLDNSAYRAYVQIMCTSWRHHGRPQAVGLAMALCIRAKIVAVVYLLVFTMSVTPHCKCIAIGQWDACFFLFFSNAGSILSSL